MQEKSSVFRHLQIRHFIVRLIEQHPGESVYVPSIAELAKMFSTSRPTVSKAMKSLRDDGLVVGRRGVGVFTVPNSDFALYHHE
ncbi:MAG: winged helix-turn-helix domain-containing protein, partial [Victivallaceae bacterium]|nr:winged helix-turn-helix domain-containing protein [Victivallaceae bacterium]